MRRNKTLIRSLILALGLFSTTAEAATYEFRSFIANTNIPACPITKLSTSFFNYTGSLQSVNVPPGAVYAQLKVEGAGGAAGYGNYASGDTNSDGGDGDLLSGKIDLKPEEVLDVIVGQGGQENSAKNGSGGGGGLSGIFTGTPSSNNALLVAGGGGGGANSYPNSLKNGTDANFDPTPTHPFLSGGIGFGGGGEFAYNSSKGVNGEDGSYFSQGGTGTGNYSGPGGFGGGGSGGSWCGAGGGGGGLPGGAGGAGESTTCTSYGGQGGTSFAASSVKNLSESIGALGGGPKMSVGQNGYVQITFYGCAG